ncbi:MAG: hypothetical protein ABIR67_12190 [Gaiellaceae bacterium]
MHSALAGSGGVAWIHKLGAIGAILIPVGVLISFFTSGDSGNTAAELIADADDSTTGIWLLQIVALLTPLLIGVFVASLWMRLRTAHEGLRALTLIGGTLFAAFLAVGLTLWAAPLLDNGDLTEAGAEAYLTFDDAGWVLLGLAGISIGVTTSPSRWRRSSTAGSRSGPAGSASPSASSRSPRSSPWASSRGRSG